MVILLVAFTSLVTFSFGRVVKVMYRRNSVCHIPNKTLVIKGMPNLLIVFAKRTRALGM